jgi:predicted permease
VALPPSVRRLFRLATGRSTSEADLREELRLHLQLAAEELIEQGMAPDAARAEAARRFGDVRAIHRTVRTIDRRTERLLRFSDRLEALVADFRYALRGLRRSPGFALGTALTLGIGIGLNTAIFSVFDAVLLRPLPYAEPDRLVRLWSSKPDRGLRFFSVSMPDYRDWKTQAHSFERLAAYDRQQSMTLTGTGDPEQLLTARVSAETFAVLGVRPVLGRAFRPDEDLPGAPGRPMLLSYGLWERRFGRDPAILGKILTLNDEPWTVVGVMPRGFVLPGNPAEVLLPFGDAPGGSSLDDRGNRFLRVVGRLRPGATIAGAREEVSTIGSRLQAQYPGSNAGWTVTILGLSTAMVGEDFQTALEVLLAAVGLVLLIACGNVATMVLGRNAARGRELAVRTALGAGTGRLSRLLLAEGLVLGAIGGIMGVALAGGLVDLLRAFEPPNLPRLDEVAVDGPVLAVAALLSIGCGIAFGLVPLRGAARPALIGTLREGGFGAAGGRHRQRTQRALVVAQMMLAVLLLSGAGLLIRSLVRLQSVDLGFEPGRVLAVDVALPRTRYPSPGPVSRLYESLLERTRSLPGVLDAAAVSSVPMGGPNTGTVFAVEGRPLPDPNARPDADHRTVVPGYFHLMAIPVLAGRDFTERDDSSAAPVTIVSATTARRFWPGENPVGARIRLGDVVRGPLVEVVGVVGDVRYGSLESPEPRPMLYFPLRYTGQRVMTVLLRTAGEPAALTAAVRRELLALDPVQPVSAVRTLDEVVSTTMSPRRFNVVVLGVFAGTALLLAGIGLYGVMAYAVTQRTREIGVRLALGAEGRGVVAMVLRDSFRLVAAGVALGLAGALVLDRALASLLFQVGPHDPPSLLAASVALVLVALLGSYLPARRAARVDPLTALRAE